MNINSLTQILTILLGVMIFILMLLSIIFLVLKTKENKKESKKENYNKEGNKNISKNKAKTKTGNTEYSKRSIIDFMEFDKVEDNMIIQKDGKRFLMVVECQGVNYDLMSRVEKVAVEEGFQQFLNTLRHPGC